MLRRQSSRPALDAAAEAARACPYASMRKHPQASASIRKRALGPVRHTAMRGHYTAARKLFLLIEERMKVRDVVIFTGKRFEVPQGIQRIDHRAAHGWQLRYGGTKLYSDGTSDGTGASAAPVQATKELLSRIAKLPAPSKLQREPNENRTTDLPIGISGPIVRLRKGARCTTAACRYRCLASAIRRAAAASTSAPRTPTRAPRARAGQSHHAARACRSGLQARSHEGDASRRRGAPAPTWTARRRQARPAVRSFDR
jgi:hypothetical protein